MKYILIISIVLALSISALCAAESPYPANTSSAKDALLIDDFSAGDTATSDKWWKFDNIKVLDKKDKYGNYIVVKGKAADWYIGGLGTYVAKDAAKFKNIKMKIYGKGKDSGKIKVEVVEDDIGSSDVDSDTSTHLPTKDDKFTSQEIIIDWTGWKTITIPVSEMTLANPGAGDGKWNPSTKGGHYGLLHFQIIVVATSETGNADFAIRDIRLTK